MTSRFGPPPTRHGGRTVIAADVTRIEVELRFDVAAALARATATVELVVDGPGGHPALDLRQPIGSVRLDDRRLDGDAIPHVDLGGGDGAEMRVLDVELAPGSRHRLAIDYELGPPAAAEALPVGWTGDGVRFDLWMSDLFAGRYLEQWIPAPLCHDRFALDVVVDVVGTTRPHLLVTNSGAPLEAGRRWRVSYPPSFTSLSPLLVLAPADEVEWRSRSVALPTRARPIELRVARHAEVDADLGPVEADVASWLGYLDARYGPWAHGETMTAFVWALGRGMEYDGATTAAVEALEHEVFHSWFGRGVKPARASDGWIDEAVTTWATASRRVEGARFAVSKLGLDEEPVLLFPPSPWSRHTPMASYSSGARLLSGVAAAIGGAGRLRSVLAAFYAGHRGGLVTTQGLLDHLNGWSPVDLGPWWDRYVHGHG